MRKYIIPQSSTLTYLLGDHLGSTSLAVKDTITGVWANDVLSETRYKPWGEVRYATTNTTLPTRYTYTGQYSYINDEATDLGSAGFGLMFYNARWYDPYLNHFTQPDSIVPDQYNSQDYDRYSYARSNPLRYTDPSGHYSCDYEDDNGNCKAYTTSDYIKSYLKIIKDRYNWVVKGKDWALKELETIYQVGLDIEKYVDGLTGGKGREWMLRTLGYTTLVHGNLGDGAGRTMPKLFGATITLDKDWLTKGWAPHQKLAHEFGHVYDINTGNYLGVGGGPADDLVLAMGGNPYLSPCRWCTGKPDPHNPPGRWTQHLGYGNESVNDYFAEAFSWSVYGGSTPPGVNDWMVDLITYEASFLQ
jgi:RHS repeat-associated protein